MTRSVLFSAPRVLAGRTEPLAVVTARSEGVPLGAGLFLGVLCWRALAAKVVLLWSHHFKVFWLHAERNAAQVVKLHSFWHRAVEQFPREAMSVDVTTRGTLHPENAISNPVGCTSPNPTRLGFVDLRPKANFGRDGAREAFTCSPKAFVMAFAKRLHPDCWLRTTGNSAKLHGMHYTMLHY